MSSYISILIKQGWIIMSICSYIYRRKWYDHKKSSFDSEFYFTAVLCWWYNFEPNYTYINCTYDDLASMNSKIIVIRQSMTVNVVFMAKLERSAILKTNGE